MGWTARRGICRGRERRAENAGNVRVGGAEQHGSGGMFTVGMHLPESFFDEIIKHEEESWQTGSQQTHRALQKLRRGKKSHALLGFH